MLDKPICITDIETTGGSSKHHAITEIAIIKVFNGQIIDEYSTLINPGVPIPHFITNITGITDADVANAPYFNEIAGHISDFYEGSYFMAHNVLFDFSFIKRQLEAAGHSFAPRLLCSVKLSRKMYANQKGHSLEKIIQRHGIQTASRHRAYDDALAVWDFMNITQQEHGEPALIEALLSQLKLKSLPSNFDEKYLEGIENSPGVYIFKDKEGTPVYIGKSVSLRNRILSHFSQSTTLNKELRISQNTHSLEVIKTDSELEALLLESSLIKEKLPIHNRMLRRKKVQTVLLREENEDGYYTVKLLDTNIADLAKPDEIFGIFDNRRSAKQKLIKYRDEHGLCSKLLGLENTKGPCFYSQLGKCKGACISQEPKEFYNLRFDHAFQKSRVQSWKYNEPMLFKTGLTRGIIVDQWIVKGKVTQHPDSEPEIELLEASFDMDNYKILRRFIKNHRDLVISFSM